MQVIKVAGFSCPDKYVLMKGGAPIVMAKGMETISKCITYVEGYDVEITDGKVKKVLDGYR